MESTQLEQAWGALAGIACGLGVRYIGVVLEAAGAAGAAVVVGACFIMMIDALSDR